MPKLLRRMLLGIVLVVPWFDAATAATPAGSVVATSGQCFVEAEGKRTPLKLGDVVNVADILDVPADAKLKLRMNDGSILSVAAGSQMTITTYTIDADGKRHDVELSLAQGLMRAVVAPIDRPARFEVKTAIASAAVRSTDWFIEAQPGVVTAAVLVGSVALTGNASGGSVEIPARRGATAEAGHDPTPPRLWRQAEFNALIARTEPAQPRAPRRAARPADDHNPIAAAPPGGYPPQPPPGTNAPPGTNGPGPYNPAPYYPPPGGPGPPRGYNPYPGGSPGGGSPGGGSPGGGYGQPPGGGPTRSSPGTHPY
jgi:FecR protein